MLVYEETANEKKAAIARSHNKMATFFYTA